jgi:general stress protein YciG
VCAGDHDCLSLDKENSMAELVAYWVPYITFIAYRIVRRVRRPTTARVALYDGAGGVMDPRIPQFVGATMANMNHMSKSNRGFAAMDTTKQREIASKGGRAAHAQGTAHEFSPDEAREAGRKGGMAVSRDRDHMSSIGRKGGEARGAARRVGV